MIGWSAQKSALAFVGASAVAVVVLALEAGQANRGIGRDAPAGSQARNAPKPVPLSITIPAIAHAAPDASPPVRVEIPALAHPREVPASEYASRVEQIDLWAQKGRIDSILADRYWNPGSLALDDAKREALRSLMQEDVRAVAAAKRAYADGIDTESDRAFAEGRIESAWPSKDGKTPPLPPDTPPNAPIVMLTKDGTTLRVVMDSAHFPQLDASRAAFDAQRDKLHNDVVAFIATNGISKSK